MGGKIKMTNKKRTNKILMSLGIFGIVALLGMSMVFAYQGDPNVQGPNFSEERHTAIQDAFEDGDYQAWYDLMTKDGRHPKILDVVDEDNFDEFIEARNAGPDALKEFRESLGLGLGQMKHGNGEALGKGQGKGLRKGQGNYCFSNFG